MEVHASVPHIQCVKIPVPLCFSHLYVHLYMCIPYTLTYATHAHTHTHIRGLLEIWKMMLEKTEEISKHRMRVADMMLSSISEEMRQQKRVKEQVFKKVGIGGRRGEGGREIEGERGGRGGSQGEEVIVKLYVSKQEQSYLQLISSLCRRVMCLSHTKYCCRQTAPF